MIMAGECRHTYRTCRWYYHVLRDEHTRVDEGRVELFDSIELVVVDPF